MISSLRNREIHAGRDFETQTCRRRTQCLEISRVAAIPSVHEGGLTFLSLELTEYRYLLGAATDSSFAIYDTAHASNFQDSPCCVCKVDRTSRHGHKFSVSCAIWYPVDSGLFVTGSYDRDVKVWDANALQAACEFTLNDPVNAVAMSRCATGHCLIASTTAGPDIRLCDPNSGSFSHSLTGHRDGVWAVAWSLENEWELVSGGCDGQVRLWDIRTPGAVRYLDEHQTQKRSINRKAKSRHRADQSIDHAIAHEGAITAVLPTEDGNHWLTAGTDSRIRLWDSSSLRNLLVNFRQSSNRASKARQIALASSARILFHPSGSIIQAYDILTGEQKYVLKGHMDAVNACCFNESSQELYTGANDRQICVWSQPSKDIAFENADNWSP